MKQERLYLRRLMLDLQGSARSSLDFYRLGKVVGEGSFAQVSAQASRVLFVYRNTAAAVVRGC